VEVGEFPFLESIFTIFGKLTGISPVFIPKRAISWKNYKKS
jgi:hypothetical protein